MKYYRCYLLTADNHIARVTILKCADAADAERQCREVLAASGRYAGAEVWDGAHRLYRYPDNPDSPGRDRLRKGDETAEDWAVVQPLSAQGGKDRREQQLVDAVAVAHLREEHLAQAAVSSDCAAANDHRSVETSRGSAAAARPSECGPKST